MLIRMYPLCDHNIVCLNLCNTSLVGALSAFSPAGFHLLSQLSLQLGWPWDKASPCQSDTCRSHLRDSGKAFVFPDRPRWYHPFLLLPTVNLNGTSRAVVAAPGPRGMTSRTTGLKPRTLTSVELLSRLKQCQQLPPSGLIIKQEKTQLSMLKLILLMFSLACS